MFFRILIKYILGYINIKIEGYFVEKFINKCINENIYEIICKELDGKNVKFVVDASQKLLMNCLKYTPFFTK